MLPTRSRAHFHKPRPATGAEQGTGCLAELNRCKDRHCWHKTHLDHLVIRIRIIGYACNMH